MAQRSTRGPRPSHPNRRSPARGARPRRALPPPSTEALRSVLAGLRGAYPKARCTLDFETPFQLFVATVLSAQCTDARVNQVTPALFARFPDAPAFAVAPPRALEALIRPTGFFRAKAKNLQGAARRIVEAFDGELPRTLEELVTLPGTGRKTANVVLGCAYGIPGITVDTHVRRVSQRLGWTHEQDPVKIEFELMERIPRRSWTATCLRLIQHGRQVCQARLPRCAACGLRAWCPTGERASPPR